MKQTTTDVINEGGWDAEVAAWEPLAFPSPAISHIEALTGREQAVLAYIAVGHTLDQAAQRLGVSRNTAHTHLKHIYDKLGISSRVEAVVAAARLRLVRL